MLPRTSHTLHRVTHTLATPMHGGVEIGQYYQVTIGWFTIYLVKNLENRLQIIVSEFLGFEQA